MVKRTTEERFWNKVNKTESCWLWTAALDTHGYGHFYVGGSIAVGAHRYAYELLVGPIPAGMTLDHLCHNADPDCRGGRACIHRRCVNPTHLGVATSRENTLRGSASQRPTQPRMSA